MESLEMIHASNSQKRKSIPPVISRSSIWMRAPKRGIVHLKKLGDRAREEEIFSFILDPSGGPREMTIKT